MGCRWSTYTIQLSGFTLLILLLELQGCLSLNSEGFALLKFRDGVDIDPYGSFANWNPEDPDPCSWLGVHCQDGKVHMLDLNGYSLEGELAPELGELTQLTSLVLSKNQFFGEIPKKFGQLRMLEILDLRDNSLSGTIPAEIAELQFLKRLLLSNNNFEGSLPSEIGKLSVLTELQYDENLTFGVAAGIGCVNRKFGHCIWQSGVKPPNRAEFLLSPLKGALIHFYLFPLFKLGKESLHSQCRSFKCSTEPHIIQPVQWVVNSARRRLAQQSSNLAAAPVNGDHIIALPSSRSSGSFPAVPKEISPPASSPIPPQQGSQEPTNAQPSEVTNNSNSKDGKSGNTWKYIVGILSGIFLLIAAVAMLIIFKSRAARTIRPWKTGLSGQLQKAFITGVPKLNRVELEQACEDFSNIIEIYDACTVYKGTLSSGVEIAVVSTAITSLKDWTKRAEIAYRKKIDSLSRVNHKNFVNLIGYCEEEEPFTRMMVFEYAPNGTLFEHLHIKEVEHLDWSARMRAIMGTAYCLQYMHDLKPPVPHSNVNSQSILLTDDYAAKVAEISFWSEFICHSKTSGESDSEHSELPPLADAETNVYNFGLVLLETISGKLPHSEEGPILIWATQYLNDKRSLCSLIDPTLKSFKNNELEVICEVIQECIQPDARKRPTFQEIIERLRAVLDISPDAATPRLSPLWWAELEILSAEAP